MTDTFITLFQGNPAVIGTEEGGCDRSPHNTTADHMAWWVNQMQQHLDGGPQAGVYPMVQTPDGFVVHWGCIDVDEGEEASLIHASNIVTVLRKFGVTGWIERSRSKGYHVWVFAQDWVPAQLMRHALLAAAQIAQAPTREINPKQSTLADGAVGNYVRLPYPGDNPGADEKRRMVVDHTLDEFVTAAHASAVDAPTLEPLAALYKAPQLVTAKSFGSGSVSRAKSARRRMSGLAWHMYTNGCGRQDDRSEWLWAFSRELTKCDLTLSEAQEFLYEAHDQHAPKWDHRADRGRPQLDRMLAKASGAVS